MKRGIRDANGQKIVSYGEQSCSIKKTVGCGVLSMFWFLPYAFYFIIFFVTGVSLSPVAVALFITSVLCTYPVL